LQKFLANFYVIVTNALDSAAETHVELTEQRSFATEPPPAKDYLLGFEWHSYDMSKSNKSLQNDDSSSKSDQSVIEAVDVRKEYPGVVANDDVNLSIKEEEFFTILGPSGSGKSTLLQIITGIETPTSGDIYISDERVNDVKPYNRNTGLVFQEYALFPHLTARENIEYGLKLRGIDESERQRRADEMFELMELTGKEDRQVTELSGGERQRVATARSLVIEPDVLLLDEVLGSLDEKLAKDMQVELKRLQEEIEKTFVFVTHSQEEAFSMSDRIAIMHEGAVVQVGRPLEVYQNPKTEFVADFLGVNNVFEGTITAINRGTLTLENEGLKFNIATDGRRSLTEGDQMGFFVANERMKIGGSYQNEMKGTIRDTIFKGPYAEYAITLAQTDEEVRVHESTGQDLHQEGTEVTIGFAAAAATLLE
jgi:ABC-type Fe3+/spermidine/putrescine transport system ATPase subunit